MPATSTSFHVILVAVYLFNSAEETRRKSVIVRPKRGEYLEKKRKKIYNLDISSELLADSSIVSFSVSQHRASIVSFFTSFEHCIRREERHNDGQS